jgi:hypothetical protein
MLPRDHRGAEGFDSRRCSLCGGLGDDRLDQPPIRSRYWAEKSAIHYFRPALLEKKSAVHFFKPAILKKKSALHSD